MLVNYRLYQVGVSEKNTHLCAMHYSCLDIYTRMFTIIHMSNQGASLIDTAGMIGMQTAKLSVDMPVILQEKRYLIAK